MVFLVGILKLENGEGGRAGNGRSNRFRNETLKMEIATLI